MEGKSSRPAHQIARKAHSVSDSDSDTESYTVGRSGSLDLFDDSSEEKSNLSSNPKSVQIEEVKQENEKHNKASTSSKDDIFDADTDVDEETEEDSGIQKPLCQYGSKCYRKNPSHLEEFLHPVGKRKPNSQHSAPDVSGMKKKPKIEMRKHEMKEKTPLDVFEEFHTFGFFLTKVKGIPSKFNERAAMDLKDILSKSMGELRASCHFNFMFEIPWILRQYPEEFRKKPILLVHGDSGRAEQEMKDEIRTFPQISLCKAHLEMPFGTHHTKMMLLMYDTGMRVVIHTANLIQNDWHQKTQGIWISPVFPRLTKENEKGDSRTGFKTDLLKYLAAYRAPKLAQWERYIQAHDMSAACVHIVASVPGRHTLNNKNSWGHLKLKKILEERGPEQRIVKNWPLAGQFSSIGSLGASKDAWLVTEWGQSLSACKKGMTSSLPSSKFNLIFPSKDNIRLSLEGYNGGGCVPYSIKTASKQPWLTPFFCQWLSEGRGRSKAVPHIKTYTRFSPDGSQAAWFLLTSANLSKAAWGALEKKGSQLMIRSYELGVLFMPQNFDYEHSFSVSSNVEGMSESDKPVFPLPYDLPPTTYVKGDRPWFIDVPTMDLPDTFGRKWCPPL